MPLMPLIVMSPFDTTVTYTDAKFRMLLVCPKPIPGMEKITTFSLSLWLTMGLVFFLTTAVFWCAANGPYQPKFMDLQTYKSVSHCFYNAWAISKGVSVTQLSTASKIRVFFLMYVCYCSNMSTVFQALSHTWWNQNMKRKLKLSRNSCIQTSFMVIIQLVILLCKEHFLNS
jgi:hypothetical protein